MSSLPETPPGGPTYEVHHKPFSKQKSADKERALQLWEDAYISAGQDLTGALSFFLKHTHPGKTYRRDVIDGLYKALDMKKSKSEENIRELLEGLIRMYNTEPNEMDRNRILQMLVPWYNRSELAQMGIEVPKETFEKIKRNTQQTNNNTNNRQAQINNNSNNTNNNEYNSSSSSSNNSLHHHHHEMHHVEVQASSSSVNDPHHNIHEHHEEHHQHHHHHDHSHNIPSDDHVTHDEEQEHDPDDNEMADPVDYVHHDMIHSDPSTPQKVNNNNNGGI